MPTSNDLFVDTSGWVFYLDRKDPKYGASVALVRSVEASNRRLVTTNYVVTELVPLLTGHYHLPRQSVIKAIDWIKNNRSVEIVHIDHDLDKKAWEFLKKYSDKEWSLVDASSFLIMKRFGMTLVLTGDHHFEQVGFGFKLLPSV